MFARSARFRLHGKTLLPDCLILCIVMLPASLVCQSNYISSGYGNFEGFNIGMRHETKKAIFRYGIGTDFNVFGQGTYNCVFGSIGRPLLKEQLHTSNILSLHGKILLWNIENPSNIFSAAAFSPQLQFTRKMDKRFYVSVYAGYVYSSVFRYKRKSYDEIGWPREWLPDFGFSVNYCLSCK
jgi:hypothetical protein